MQAGTELATELTFAQKLPMTRAAIVFADEHHGAQVREADRAPFLVHPLEVASFLERSECPDHVIAAAVLHDVLEDTDTGRDELERDFGREVAELVALVSDDPSIKDEERQKDDVRERVRHAERHAQVIYASDKVSKVRELRMLLAAGMPWDHVEVRRRRYRRSLGMLEDAIPDERVVELLRFELEALETLPPRPPQV
jgi:(p)ppGpp synthase/HD superfamily hydrolase